MSGPTANRREACLWVAVPALAATLPAAAQRPAELRVAWVSVDDSAAASPVFDAFRAGLAELGYEEGRNLRIDGWWGAGSTQRLVAQRPELIRARPAVVVAQGGVALSAVLPPLVPGPVVFSMSGDPVDAGIVASYARPGGQATGITLFAAQLAGKRIAYLKEADPRLRGIALIHNPRHPGALREVQAARDAAAALGVKLRPFGVESADALDVAMADVARAAGEAMLVLADGFALTHGERIAAFALRHRIATAAGWASFAERGALLAYGPQFADVYRRLASYVDRIHKGAYAADLPIEQPTRFELVLNLRTARALGLAMPRGLLAAADRVVE